MDSLEPPTGAAPVIINQTSTPNYDSQNNDNLTDIPLTVKDSNSNLNFENNDENQISYDNLNNDCCVEKGCTCTRSTEENYTIQKNKSNTLQRIIDNVWKKIPNLSNNSGDSDVNVIKIESIKNDYNGSTNDDENNSVSSGLSTLTSTSKIFKNMTGSKRLRFRTAQMKPYGNGEQKRSKTNDKQIDQELCATDSRKNLKDYLSTYWNTVFRKVSKVKTSIPSNSNDETEMKNVNENKNENNVNSNENQNDNLNNEEQNYEIYEMIECNQNKTTDVLNNDELEENSAVLQETVLNLELDKNRKT